MKKDTGVYKATSRFRIEVFPGVFWVSLNTLGESRYSFSQMQQIVSLESEEKRERIGNLYEAVQLFQASDFQGELDNANHWLSENCLWQTHTTGFEAVKRNRGCCAADTNWLRYILDGKYEDIFSLCYCNEDGNGHIMSGIQQGGCYYFLDMMMCRNDSQSYLCPENGDVQQMHSGEWAGFLFECKDMRDYCRYHISRCREKGRAAPFAFYFRRATDAYATGLAEENGRLTFLLPEEEKCQILYLEEETSASVKLVALPRELKTEKYHG